MIEITFVTREPVEGYVREHASVEMVRFVGWSGLVQAIMTLTEGAQTD